MSNIQNQSQEPNNTAKEPTTEPQRGILRDKKVANIVVRPRTSTSSSSGLSLATPRTARFAEATSVNSPIGPVTAAKNPFADPPERASRHLMAQPQPSDVGFGYLSDNDASKHTSSAGVEMPPTPASPLKSALKVPGTPGRLNPLSPTFKEEQDLEKHEEMTEKENAKDLKVKTRVRMAKMCLRGTNFSCSLIVLSMLSTTFSIFNNSKSLANRGNLPVWAQGTQKWPQITLLTIACVSLFCSLLVFYAYWRGGHKRAEKAAIYYTFFAIAFFAFNTIMWIVGAAVLNESKRNGKGNDMWGWSCKSGKRKTLFDQDVDYALVCRLQSWSLICAFIEITVEVITIAIYGIVFYRFYSKRRLHKSMNIRDKARSDLYLAQLRVQSAPNTPGFQKTPMSANFPSNVHDDDIDNAEKGESTQYASKHQSFSQPKPIQLQAPPIKIHSATPAMSSDGFDDAPTFNDHVPAAPGEPTYDAVPVPGTYEHVPAAPGEETYDAVPIPGAYANPLPSPGSAAPGQAYTAEGRIESPPGSPRLQHGSLR